MANIYSKNSFIKKTVLFTVSGILLSFLLLIISSLIMSKFNKYELSYPYIVPIIQSSSAFFAGRFLGKAHGHFLLFVGLLEGALICLTFLLLSLLFCKNEVNYTAMLTSALFLLSSGVLGSITSSRK